MSLIGAHRPHNAVQKFFDPDEGRCKKEFAEECNINVIMKRFEKTGVLDHVAKHQGQYGDFTEAVDYHTALNMLHSANDMFMSLPAQLRAQFNNDPGEFLAFANDPENEEEMRELGLLPPKPREASESGGKKVAHEKPKDKKAATTDEEGAPKSAPKEAGEAGGAQ